MKVIIAGGRNFTNCQRLTKTCNKLLENEIGIEIVSGAYYKGADLLGEQYAKEKGHKLTQFPVNWKRYEKAAGPKRNAEMANYADVLIAFWDGKSKGTKHMIKLAKSSHLIVNVSYY